MSSQILHHTLSTLYLSSLLRRSCLDVSIPCSLYYIITLSLLWFLISHKHSSKYETQVHVPELQVLVHGCWKISIKNMSLKCAGGYKLWWKWIISINLWESVSIWMMFSNFSINSSWNLQIGKIYVKTFT